MTSKFMPSTIIDLQIDDNPERIAFDLIDSAVLGRADVSPVEIDLTPFHAAEKGLSRRHAILEREQKTITVRDLDSVSGIFVNGQRVRPGERCILHDGDEIRLGMLRVRVYF